MAVKEASHKINWSLLLFAILAIGGGALVSLLVASIPSSSLLLLIVGGSLAAIAMFVKKELGLLVLVFAVYTRLSDVMIKYHGAPSSLQPLIGLLLFIILLRWAMYHEHPRGWERPMFLVTVYGLVGLASLLYAADYTRAQIAYVEYLKDALIVVIVAILLQRAVTMRRVIWTLLAAGIFLGTISVYQHLTGTFSNSYWGFGQSEIQHIVGTSHGYRIAGSVGDPNFYAQILLVLIPLALDRLWNESNRLSRLLAGWALAVCTLSVFFTFSRGGFLALILILIFMILRHPPRPMVLVITVLIAMPLLQFLPAGYTDRLRTIPNAIPGLGQQDVREEASLRGRTSSLRVGWLMFNEQPFLGVGLHNYPVHYQEYSRQVGLDPQRGEATPHNLYLEVAAETGILGLTAFGALLLVMFRGLYQARADFLRAGKPDYASMTVAFGIGLIGYLIAALFLHASYPRFFWLLFGIALAIPYVAKQELTTSGETV